MQGAGSGGCAAGLWLRLLLLPASDCLLLMSSVHAPSLTLPLSVISHARRVCEIQLLLSKRNSVLLFQKSLGLNLEVTRDALLPHIRLRVRALQCHGVERRDGDPTPHEHACELRWRMLAHPYHRTPASCTSGPIFQSDTLIDWHQCACSTPTASL
jgi:hypothetical protein